MEHEPIKADKVEVWEWGYLCPDCGGKLELTDDEDCYDKLDKTALTNYKCPDCGHSYSALYELVSLRQEDWVRRQIKI